MRKIDTHNHYWLYNPQSHQWIDNGMKVIQRDFMPQQFNPILLEHGFDGTVVVQVDKTQQENEFLIGLAKENPLIKGIVGWVDLRATDLAFQLEKLTQHKILKGFRHIAQAEHNSFLAQADMIKGVQKLSKHGFTYDILINPLQIAAAVKLVAACPDQKFVLDHIAKPYIKKGEIEPWKQDIKKLAAFENVYCKVSGMVTEADWTNWKAEDYFPYMDVVFEAFGSNRLMFGSDWPVCLLAADYKQVLNIVEAYIKQLSNTEQEAFWGLNAIEFYKLNT